MAVECTLYLARPLSLPARSLSTNQLVPNSKERKKQHETSSAIGGELIMEDDGYPTVQNPYSTKPLKDVSNWFLNVDF